MISWPKLIRGIAKQQVLPILGPELSSIKSNGENVPIREWLAPRLAKVLRLDAPDTQRDLNQIACLHLIRGGNRSDIYEEIGVLIDELLATKPELPHALLELASIDGFDLFITSSFDPFLPMAVAKARPGFDPREGQGVAAFHPNNAVDLPSSIPSAFVYHILGTYNTFPDFGVWEEDYLEFTCGLLKPPKDTLRNLFNQLNSRSLLFLGSPFNDWVVRFFLRIAKDRRLSDQTHSHRDYFADELSQLEKPMVFYFDQVIKSPQFIPSDPAEFVRLLAEKWREYRGESSGDDLLNAIPDEPEDGTIFVSYSRDNKDEAVALAKGLRAAGLPVWLDTGRLRSGTDWEHHIMRAIKTRSSLFLSLISNATEEASPGSLSRFVHTERRWAAEKHVPGHIFYIPVIIEPDFFVPKQEPEAFARIDLKHLPGGVLTPDFALQLKNWHNEYKKHREIRDV